MEICKIRRHEETRRSWRTINRSYGKARGKGISQVDIQKDREWITVTARDEVEPAIMDNNSKRFNLTLTTPLISRYAVEKIGYLAEKDGATAILDCTFEYDPKLDEFTNKF